jgi:hypothetical protein
LRAAIEKPGTLNSRGVQEASKAAIRRDIDRIFAEAFPTVFKSAA